MGIFNPIIEFFVSLFNYIYEMVQGFGLGEKGTELVISVILLTVLVRLAILPFNIKSARSTQKMQEIQPEVKKIQDKYKNDPQKANMEVMKLYKERNVSMTGGCLPILLTMPILLALYQVFKDEAVLQEITGASFLFINDLGASVFNSIKSGNYLVVVLPALSFLSTYLPSLLISKASPSKDEGGMNMSGMNVGMSAMMAVMSFQFQNILVLYWIMGGVIQLIQTYFVNYLPAVKKRQEKEAEEASIEKVSGASRFAMPVEDNKAKKKKKK